MREHGEKLVRLTSLRTLSSLVGEWVPADIVPLDAEAVNSFDRQVRVWVRVRARARLRARARVQGP